jgi:ABC-type glycerol-3-phosphate transport system permease component
MTTDRVPVPSSSRPAAKHSRRDSGWLQLILIYLILVVFTLFILIPFIWPFLSAFTTKPANVSSMYLYWPKSFTWIHFFDAIAGRGQALSLLKNSLITTISSVVLALICAALGGYALSRGKFRYKRLLMFSLLLIQIIPATATVLPLYLIMRQFKMVDSLLGVSVGVAVGQLPFMLWVLKGFIDTVPKELEEAAWLDGATSLQTITQVVVPLALPGVGAASILAFNSAWSVFFLPLILLSDSEKFTMPLGLFRSLVAYTNMDYGMLNAMALLYMLPSLLIFVFARQYLIRGTMAGAMAGQ